MTAISSCRLACVLATTVLLSSGLAAADSSPVFSPINNPPSTQHHPGKFVWADLFTTDPVAATKFYTGLFGWTASVTDQNGKAYTVFSNGGHPVAGLAPRTRARRKEDSSRWIAFVAVNDLNASLALVKPAGGIVRAPARDFPDRGVQAIITDNEGAPIGLLQSSSGDAVDDEPDPGEWNWFVLYAKDPAATAGFYGKVFAYTVAPDTRTARKNDWILGSEGLPRAGVAPLPARDDAEPGWLGVVRVANMDQTLARVPLLGGEVLLAARPAAYGSRFAIIADSTGGTIGLVEYVDNANPATRP